MAYSPSTTGTVRNLGGDLLGVAIIAALLGVATLWCAGFYSSLGDTVWATFYWDFGVYSVGVAIVLAVVGKTARLATR
jgi:hypothetical protein